MTPTVKLIADIVQASLGLSAERVWIYNQRREIPRDKGLFVVVGRLATVPYANVNDVVMSSTSATETQFVAFQETLKLEVFSHDTSAIERDWEVVAALHSLYAEDSAMANTFRLAQVPTSMVDTSFLEGTSILYRTSMTVQVLRAYSKTLVAAYYDTFTDSILTEEGEV